MQIGCILLAFLCINKSFKNDKSYAILSSFLRWYFYLAYSFSEFGFFAGTPFSYQRRFVHYKHASPEFWIKFDCVPDARIARSAYPLNLPLWSSSINTQPCPQTNMPLFVTGCSINVSASAAGENGASKNWFRRYPGICRKSSGQRMQWACVPYKATSA